MAERTETETVETEQTTTYYVCDKCHGHNHEETTWKEDLNVVAFGAEAHMIYSMPVNTFDAHGGVSSSTRSSPDIASEYEYLLCDECMERAYDYLSDFF